jgi:rubrerythrin
MHDDILKKLEGRLDRRSFLRGSGLFAAAALTVAAFPGSASAQDPAQEPKKDEPKKENKPAEESKKDDAPKTEPKDDKDKKEEPDPFKVTRKDERGRDYRLCPQCGYNMYKQERTWTCENCGYSYTE